MNPKLLRYALALAAIAVMIIVSRLSGIKDIIFPEIAALAIGAWVAEKLPWDVNKRRIFFLMTLSSILGVCIYRYVHIPVIWQLVAGFGIILGILHFAKTNFVPVISACLLPILLKTGTWVYPLSVGVMSVLIITGQWLLEKYGIKEKNKFVPRKTSTHDELLKWAKLLLLLIFIAFLPIKTGKLFIIAPPLIVIFTEFSNVNSKLRNFPLRVIDLVGLAALVEVSMILFLNAYLPLTVCTLLAVTIMFFAFEKAHLLLPPVGAILLLPLLLDKDDLLLYPFEVMFGCALFIGAAMFTFKKQPVEEKKYLHK